MSSGPDATVTRCQQHAASIGARIACDPIEELLGGGENLGQNVITTAENTKLLCLLRLSSTACYRHINRNISPQDLADDAGTPAPLI